jgi:DNA polymerase elongation subunit (family B)
MERLLFILDVDYVLTKEKRPIIRLFCKDEDGNNFIAYYANFLPYFYVYSNNAEEIAEKIKNLKIQEAKIENVEIVEKKICGKPKKVLKVTINNPKKIPKVRKIIKDTFSVETFEYDIPFYKRFLTDIDIWPAWIKVAGKEKGNKIFVEKIEKAEINKFPKLKILAFDIEIVEERDSEKIILISFVSNYGFKKCIGTLDVNYENYEKVSSEKDLIRRFVEIIKEQDADIICGYNTDSFDIPKIKEKAEKYGIELRIGREDSKIKSVRRGFVKTFKIPGRIYLDLYVFVDHILSPNIKTEVLTLDAVAKEFLGYGKKEMSFKEMQELYQLKENLEKIVEYNIWDSELVLKLCELFLPLIFSISKVTYLIPFDSCRSTYSQLVEAYLLKNAFRENEIAPNRPKREELEIRRISSKYKGAIVFEPKIGIQENIFVFDFRSLYPTIIIAHNISPETLNCGHEECKENKVPELGYHFCKKTVGLIPKYLSFLVEERKKIKKIMKEEKNEEIKKILDNYQHALKIVSNATYGYMGYIAARWYKKECAESVTAFGRYYIKKIANIAKDFGFEIIYGDTDSLMLTYNKEDSQKKVNEFLNFVNSSLPKPMELEFRGFYLRGIFVKRREEEKGAKKRYALLSENNEIEIRGFETVRRDWCKLAKNLQRKVIELVLNKKVDEAIKYVRDIIEKLKKYEFEIEDVTIYEQLTKSIKEYKQISPHVIAAKKAMERGIKISEGSIIPFVIVKGKGSISDRAEMNIFVRKEDVDIEYYITNQILPAATRVLKALGYSEVDILSQTKQKTLFSFFRS